MGENNLPSEERLAFINSLIDALHAEKREIGYGPDSDVEARKAISKTVRRLKIERGVRSYRDYKWAKKSHCGYCGSSRIRKMTSRPAYIEVECMECDFIDFRDVS